MNGAVLGVLVAIGLICVGGLCGERARKACRIRDAHPLARRLSRRVQALADGGYPLPIANATHRPDGQTAIVVADGASDRATPTGLHCI